LNAEKKKLNPRSYVVKNGVDFKLFAPHSKKINFKYRNSKRVGYIGTLDFRFDITMEYAIKELPEVLFEFTGYLLNNEIRERLSTYKM
jgi:hypothetical protein